MTDRDESESLLVIRHLQAELAAVRRELAILRYVPSGKHWLSIG